MPAELTEETFFDGTPEQQQRYLTRKLLGSIGVHSATTRDKTLVYDNKGLVEQIVDIRDQRRSGMVLVSSTHGRRI